MVTGELGRADDAAGAPCGGRVTGRVASWADGGGKRKGGGTSWAAEQHAEAGKRSKEKGKGGDAGPVPGAGLTPGRRKKEAG